MTQKLAFLGLLLAISIKFSMARLNMLIVSPYLYYSHHQFDMDLAHRMTQNKEHKVDMAHIITSENNHKVHVFVPVREKEECAKVNESAEGKNFTVECYFKESTKIHWAEDEDGFINGFPAFYKELMENDELMKKLGDQKFDVGLAQLHYFSLDALKLYAKLGIKKHIGLLATSLSPNNLKVVGLLDKAMKNSVPPSNWGDWNTNTKIGDSKKMPEERKNKIREIYEKSTAKRHFKDEEKRKEFEEMSKLINGLEAIFINSRKELEWNNGEWMTKPSMKLAFIGGFNLTKKQKEKPTVLISFGTLIDTTKRVTETQISAILSAIQQFPHINFIWKVSENETRVQDTGHIKIVHWMDQRQLLAKQNTIGFISHCGRNSELEAIVNGVPLICVPFESDQFYNAEALARKVKNAASISIDIKNEKFDREVMVNHLEKLFGSRYILKNFDILHKSMNDAIEKDEMGKEIFEILDEIEKQLAQNPSD